MPPLQTPSLVAQANQILKAATSLQQQLTQNGLEQPSFSVEGRKDWHDIQDLPTLFKTRASLIDAAQEMLNLALGPIDTLASLVGDTCTKVEVLRTLDALGVPQAVPLTGSISLQNLAKTLQVNAGLLNRHLKFAYLMGMFHEPEEGLVAHTSLSTAILSFSPYIKMRTSKLYHIGPYEVAKSLQIWQEPTPIGHIQVPIELADPEHRGFWKILVEDDPDGKGMEKFSAGMRNYVTTLSNKFYTAYTTGYDWAGLGDATVVDVGGGNCHTAISISKAFPNLKFVVQDLKSNTDVAKQAIKEAKAEERVTFQAHDFFTPQPLALQPKTFLVSRVLHDWQDADCVKIIKQLTPVMERHDTIMLIFERILPDEPGQMPRYQEASVRSLDIFMFTLYGAKERSVNDWSALLTQADDRLTVLSVKRPPSSVFGMVEVGLRK